MESGSATEFTPTHRLAPELLGGLTRDLIPHAAALSSAAKGQGMMVLGVNRYRPGMLRMRLQCGAEVSVPEDTVIFAPTHWIDEESLQQQLPKDLKPYTGLLKRGASQGVVLAGSIGGNGQARLRVRFATGDELEVPARAVTNLKPMQVLPPVTNGKRKPSFVHRGGRSNGSRGW